MTIGAASRVSLACDGVTKVFPVAIQAYAATDLTVMLTAPVSAGGGQGTLVLNSDYTMAPSGTLSPTAWTLTTLPAAAYLTGYTLQVFENPVQTQQTQFVQGQPFPSLAVQTAFDRLTQMVQRLQDEVSRCIRVPDGDVNPQMLLPIASQRLNVALMTDSNGNVATGVPSTQVITLGLLAPFLGLAQTAAEAAVPVTPINYSKFPSPWKDVSRFVSDNTGATDVAQGIRNALAAESNVIFPDGTYQINSEILVNRGHITIEGSNQGDFLGGVIQGGAVIRLGAAAGAGASCFRWGSSLYRGVNVRRLGFQLNNPALAQIGLRFGQIINGHVEECIVQGQGIAGDDTTALQFDGLGIYTGDFTVRDCNLPNHKIAVNLLGSITTLRVLDNEIGGTSVGGVAGSIGVNISASTVNGVQVRGNSIQQMHDAIINLGVGSRIGWNRYEGNTNNCTNTHSANLFGVLLGSDYADGPPPSYPAGAADAMMVFERNIAYVGGTYMEAGLGFRERARAYNLGEFTTRTFAAGNYTSNAGTWVVASATTDEATIVGKMLTFAFFVAGIATGAGSELRIAIPQSATAAKRTRATIHTFQNAAYAIGIAEVQVGDAFIRCYKDQTISGSWTNGDCEVFGQITFEIQ